MSKLFSRFGKSQASLSPQHALGDFPLRTGSVDSPRPFRNGNSPSPSPLSDTAQPQVILTSETSDTATSPTSPGSLQGSRNRAGGESSQSAAHDSEDEFSFAPGEIPISTGFGVMSSRRNADFHELFPNVPEGDHLIRDYGCALQWEILIYGRLYISDNSMCFNANIFGWITNFIIPFYEVTAIEKKTTTFIRSAIQISTCRAKYTFALFLSRGTTYYLMHSTWRLWHPGPESASNEGAEISEVGAAGSSSAHKLTQCACGKEGKHFETQVMDIVIPGTPEKIYNLMFASGFLKDFMAEEQKLMEIQISDWHPEQSGSQLLARKMTYIKPRNGSIGPKQTKCELKDETLHLDFDDYVSTLTTTRTPDVPSGNVFCVKKRTCIMWAGAAASRLVVTTIVEWTGRSFIRSIIDKSAIDGQKQYHTDLEKAMRSYISAHRAEFVPDGVTEDPDALSCPNGSIGPQDELHTPHGCLDLTPLIDPLGFSSSAVAEGGFGDVWTGRLHNDGTKLAIKVLRFTSSTGDSARKELKRTTREIYNWSKLDHEHVNKLMGVIMFRERLGMVSKWMEHGNLRQYLSRNSGVDRYELCVQIARGVAYLHDVNMIHGDLKACNILVSSAGVLKITDFDYSIFPECALAFSATTRIGGGTRRWMAPELLMNEKPPQRNKTTDIYALGMTFLVSMGGVRVLYVVHYTKDF
ncbi:hypothetical protein FRC11_005138 [Ceratobasidium sp. 423]|nr:hypothetical protein FRC11_005138 [Ceratobasidium sp. 423]